MKNIISWIIDYIYLIIGQLQMLIYKNPPKSYSKLSKDMNPIIILPGIFEKWSFMKKLSDQLSSEGHSIYVIFELKNNLYDIPTSAKIVRNFIDKMQLSNVILVCHSKGGLIGKYLLINDNNDERIKKIITIATPFSGSISTKFIPYKAYLEMNPESEIIKSLQLHKNENSKIVSIYSQFDNHIWTKSGSLLEKAKNIKIPVWGHHKILFAKETIIAVIKETDRLSN